MEEQAVVVKLKPKLGLLNGVSVIVGCIIGSGIFISPTGVLKHTGSANLALLVWAMCGLFSMAGAYCYAELGCMMTRTGADYIYILTTFGPFLAFMKLWVDCMIVRPCTLAVVCLTFGIYVLRSFFPTCDPPTYAIILLAVTALCILTYVNCARIRWATRIQDFFMWSKLLALVIIIASGIFQLFRGKVEHFTFSNTETNPMVVALSFYSGLFAYFGWHMLNFITEELKDPVRNLPRAIGISCIVVTIVYVMANVAFFTTLSPQEMLQSPATFGQRLYGVMAWIIPIFVAMSTFGTINGVLMTSSRLFYAGALQGHMPYLLSMVQVHRSTPVPAVLFTTIVSILYLTSPDVLKLINYLGFATWSSIGVGVLCLPVLRKTHPEMHRPIKVSLFFPFVYLAATVFITVVPLIADPSETREYSRASRRCRILTAVIGILLILTGVPVYLVFVVWNRKLKFLSKTIGNVTECLQRIFLVVPPDE